MHGLRQKHTDRCLVKSHMRHERCCWFKLAYSRHINTQIHTQAYTKSIIRHRYLLRCNGVLCLPLLRIEILKLTMKAERNGGCEENDTMSSVSSDESAGYNDTNG